MLFNKFSYILKSQRILNNSKSDLNFHLYVRYIDIIRYYKKIVLKMYSEDS